LKPGGRLVISGTKGNKFVKLPADDVLEGLGFRVVQRQGALPESFANHVFRRTDGAVMPHNTMSTTILERIR
jgi:hypothetical protein